MSAALNNITAPDKYSAASTLSCPDTSRVRLQVNNQAIYWQRGIARPGGGGVQWVEPEEFLLPSVASLDESCDAIRVRAAIKLAEVPVGGKQAQVTVTTRTAVEVGERARPGPEIAL